MPYTSSFERAIDHAALYEVGGFWNPNHPAVKSGDISTTANKRATGYVNDPVDTGGETKFGIAKRANPSVNIARLTWDQAKQIYFDKYWLAGNCDELPPKIAIIHFDACINHGVSRAKKMLQESIGTKADGIIGPLTLTAIHNRSQDLVVKNYAQIRRNFYHNIVKNNASQSRFINGWLRRVNEVEAYALR